MRRVPTPPTAAALPLVGAGRALAAADPDALETADWLALLLELPGRQSPDLAVRKARAILDGRDLLELARAGVEELREEFGLAPGAARRVVAAFALGRRLERVRRPRRPRVRSPEAVHELLAGRFRGLDQERFLALLLDGKHRLQRIHPVSSGTLTTSLVHPREVFRPAVREAAAALIVAHNHPSGDPDPSREDLEVTRRLKQVGDLLGIPLLDHVVVGDGSFVSLRERMDWA